MIAELTTIRDLEQETIFDVIGRMEVLLEFFIRNPKYHNLVPFLETYYLITKSVAERSVEKKNYFIDRRGVEKLDVYFASLYFRPLKEFLLRGKCITPWKSYFEYCKHETGIPFVQMLLGINAHINTDLYASLVRLKYVEKKDYLLINKILAEEIPVIMKFLAFTDRDIYGLGSLIFKKFIRHEFKDVIVHWRGVAWQNYRKSRGAGSANRQKAAAAQTEDIAGKLVDIFHDIGKFKHITIVPSRLHDLTVKIN